MRVAVVSEFYPRTYDPVLGIWAHRQALAARDAGADVRVLVLHRVVPASAEPHKLRALGAMLRHPRRTVLDGLDVQYVPFASPPRPGSYGSWGSWAAPTLNRALKQLRREWPFDLVHAHNAVPAGDAVRQDVPMVVSVHGADVFFTGPRYGGERIERVFGRAKLVLANSTRVEAKARALGAERTRVVHLGTDVPEPEPDHAPHTIVTVGHLVARKRHDEVIAALRDLPGWRYVVIGDGPERARLEQLAQGLDVEFTGQLPHEQALARARAGSVFAMPATDEAFGVAYIEAMAGGLPAIGRAGEAGPEEIAARGPGMHLAGDDLAATIRGATDGAAARETARRHFTWEACGRVTVEAYEAALR